MNNPSLPYMIGLAIADLIYAVPLYLGASMLTKKTTKHKNLKTIGIGFTVLLICSQFGLVLTYGGLIVITSEVALCVWIANRRKLAKDKKDQTKDDEGISIG